MRKIPKSNPELIGRNNVYQFKTVKHDSQFRADSDFDSFVEENKELVFQELTDCVCAMMEQKTDKTTIFLRVLFVNTEMDMFIEPDELITGAINGKLDLAMGAFIESENYEYCNKLKTIKKKLNGTF